MPLKLCNDIVSLLNYVICLRVPWHLHEADGGFSHCGNGSVEDGICSVVEILIQLTWVDMRAISGLNSALGPSFILPSLCHSPDLIFILGSVYCEIVLRDLEEQKYGLFCGPRPLQDNMIPVHP